MKQFLPHMFLIFVDSFVNGSFDHSFIHSKNNY